MTKRCFALLMLLCAVFTGCGNGSTQTLSDGIGTVGNNGNNTDDGLGTEESVQVFHKLYFDIDVSIPDEVFKGHTIELYLDEQPFHKFEDGKYYTELTEIVEGSHTISYKVDEQILADLNQSIDLLADMSAVYKLTYGESLEISSYEIKDSIADSAIPYDDMANVELNTALEGLSNKHFVNVRYEANDNNSILDPADWIVVSQNVTPGSELDKAAEIVLTCRKVYFQLYFDLSFDQNLLLAKYDIDVYLDGKKIDTIPHGKKFTYLTKVKEGEHSAIFYKSTDNGVYSEKKIEVTADATLIGSLHSNNKDIELNGFEVKNKIENTSFEVANVTGMRLDKALEVLGKIGFTNVVKEPNNDIWVDYNWIVTSQSVPAGSTVDKNAKIVLNSVKTEAYLSNTYLNKNMVDASKKAKENNNEILYVDYAKNEYMTNRVSTMNESEKKLWIVKQANLNDDGKIQLNFIYTGTVKMPDVVSANLANALTMLKNAEFSDIESKAEDDSYIGDNSNWKVVSQSVQAGANVNANQKIILIVADINASVFTKVENEKISEEDVSVSSTTESQPELQEAGVFLPDSNSKLGKDYDSKGSSTIYYINVDGLINKPKLQKWGKATVTDGVAEYLDDLKSQGFKVEIISVDKQTPYTGFTEYTSSFKVSNSDISWDMDLTVQDEKYVEYSLEIQLP